jgi:hypothetical protein
LQDLALQVLEDVHGLDPVKSWNAAKPNVTTHAASITAPNVGWPLFISNVNSPELKASMTIHKMPVWRDLISVSASFFRSTRRWANQQAGSRHKRSAR